MDNQSFLGTGMKFPPQVDPGTGRFVSSSDERSVRESIYLILTTARGERWLEPNFGSQLSQYTFMDTSPTMLSIMKDDVRMTILSQEPRISEVDVEIDTTSQEGCLLFNIDYSVAGSNSEENLVFPFFLTSDRGESENAW